MARNASKLGEVETLIRSLASEVEVLSVPTDIADDDSVAALFKIVRQQFGSADVLINNAGVLNCFPDKIADADPKEWWAGFVRSLNDPSFCT